MFFASFFLTIISFLLLWWKVKRHYKYWERLGIPHDKPRIPTGNMHEWMRTKHFAEIFDETYKKFKGAGPFAGFYYNTQRAVIILDLELSRNILNKDFSHFENRGFFHNKKNDPLTGNLFLLDGKDWKTLKEKVMPAFDVENIKDLYPTMLKVAEEMQKVCAERVRASNNGIIDLHYLLACFTLDAIGNCIYGLDSRSLRNPNTVFCFMARKFFCVRKHPIILDSLINCFPGWAKTLRLSIIAKDISEFFIGTVQNIVKQREELDIKKTDFINVLMALNDKMGQDEPLTIKEMAAQAFTFFVAGFDNCATTVCYALLELAINQDVQNKLRRHILDVFNSHKKKLSYECLADMKYLDQVISETLRKYPVVAALFRKCNQHYKTTDPKFDIRKGLTVIIPSMAYHHDPMYFPVPTKFDPDRFAPANVKNIVPGSYLPYGDGERNCIGIHFARMHVAIAIVKLIKSFKFEPCSQTSFPPDVSINAFNLNPLEVKLKLTKI